MLKAFGIGLLAILVSGGPALAVPSCPGSITWHTLANTTTADAMQVMDNFNCLSPQLNPYFGGNVGINTSSPTTELYVKAGSSGGSPYLPNSTTFVTLENSGRMVVQFLAPSSSDSEGFFFGTQATPLAAQFVYEPNVNDFYWFIGGATRMNLTSSGYLGIGTASPSYLLHVNGTAYATGAAGALSDRRHKTNIKPLQYDALDIVAKLKPVTFVWRVPKDDGMRGVQTGFIAQDVKAILPNTVLTARDKDRTLGLKYNEFIPLLTKALQEQQAEIAALRAANQRQSAELRRVHYQINALQRKSGLQTAKR